MDKRNHQLDLDLGRNQQLDQYLEELHLLLEDQSLDRVQILKEEESLVNHHNSPQVGEDYLEVLKSHHLHLVEEQEEQLFLTKLLQESLEMEEQQEDFKLNNPQQEDYLELNQLLEEEVFLINKQVQESVALELNSNGDKVHSHPSHLYRKTQLEEFHKLISPKLELLKLTSMKLVIETLEQQEVTMQS